MHSLIRNFILGISLFLVPSVASAQERVVDDNGPMSVGGNVNFMYGTFEPQNSGAGFKLYFGEQPRGTLVITMVATGESKSWNLSNVEFGQRLDVFETAPTASGGDSPVMIEVSGKCDLLIGINPGDGSALTFSGSGNALVTYFVWGAE